MRKLNYLKIFICLIHLILIHLSMSVFEVLLPCEACTPVLKDSHLSKIDDAHTYNSFPHLAKVDELHSADKHEMIVSRVSPLPLSNHMNANRFAKPLMHSDTVTMSEYREYEDFCSLIVDLWIDFPNNEVQGYITISGKMLITSVGSEWTVSGPKPIQYHNQIYIPWDKKNKLELLHEGSIDYSGSKHVFIPVKAMFHTHVVSGYLSEEDQMIANKFYMLRHLLFERSRISEFNKHGIVKTYRGNMFNLCHLLKQ